LTRLNRRQSNGKGGVRVELLLHTRSISDGSRLLRLSWDSCDKMMERPVGTVWRGAPLLN
ncbi:MAG: hypothetical protein ACOYNP_16570, partial [Gemmataceae bacterium]